MRHQIYRVLGPDFIRGDKPGSENLGEHVSYLTYDGATVGLDEKIVGVGGVDATLEELVDLCDHDAENKNAHDFCGSHRLLGAILFRRYGRESATDTMREIALFGGLQGMSGVCSDGDAYEELGVGENGRDWGGKYE
jgi:hypothetical protein